MSTERATSLVERAAALLRDQAGLAPDTNSEPTRAAAPAAASAAALAAALAPQPVAEPPVAAAPPVPMAAAPCAPADGLALAEPLGIAAMAPPAPPEPPRLDMDKLRHAGLALTGRERSRISEEFRITVGRILRTLRSHRSGPERSNLLVVTSARPGEGKTFNALNIAASIAQNGLGEVLLVDMDAKPRSLTAQLNMAAAPGLLNLVANPALRVEDTLVRTAVGGLSFLPVGALDASHADPGVTRPVSATIERLSRRFAHHVVILDCAPCLSTSDPSTLAAVADQILLVVEAERTQRNELEASLELIKACPNVTLVLNKVRLTTSHTFGAYHYYGAQT